MYYTIDDNLLKIARDNSLTSSELLVYSYLTSFFKNNLECFPSYTQLEKMTLLSERQIKRIIKHLNELNILNVDKKITNKGKVNIYSLGDKMALSSLNLRDKSSLPSCQNGTTLSVKMSPNNNNIYYNNNNMPKSKSFNYVNTESTKNEFNTFDSNLKYLNKYLK